MKLTWYGHSCFKLETADGSVVFDPYAPGSVPGVEMPALEADTVFCSHGHSDHGYADGVKLTGREAAFKVQRFDSFHDNVKGLARGDNMITLIEAEGLRLVHLGDLGHMLSAAQLEALGRVDVLLIPVGGYYTINAKTARELSEALKPSVLIPMHYRGEGFGFKVIAPVEDFLSLAENVELLGGNWVEIKSTGSPRTLVLKCPVKN